MALVGVACCGAAVAQDQGLPTDGELLLLDVAINGVPLPGVFRAERRGPDLLLEAAALSQGRLVLPAQAQRLNDGRAAIDLRRIDGLRYQLDMSALHLEVVAPAEAFQRTGTDFNPTAPQALSRGIGGLFLNYETAASSIQGSPTQWASTLEAVASGSWGHVVNSVLVRHGEGAADGVQRLDTFWRYDMPARTESIVVGDAISAGGAWSRPLRFAGLRWASDYSIRPDVIKLPTATLSGEAVLPSTVDVLVNNVRRLTTEVPPGPFDIRNLPTITGAGEVNLVIRDILGRETLVTRNLYASATLLAPGVTDFSLETGLMRRGYGQDTSYQNFFAAGTWRRGFSAQWTGEVRGELQRERQAVGVNVATLLGTWASLNASLAFSRGSLHAVPEQGHLLQLGLERSELQSNVSLQYQQASRGFAPFGESADPLAPSSRVRTRWFVGGSRRLGAQVSAGLSFSRQQDWGGQSNSAVGMSLFMPLGRSANLSVAVNRQLSAEKGWYAGIYLSFPLDGSAGQTYGNSQVEFSSGRATRASAGAQRAAPIGPGYGWRVEAIHDDRFAGRGSLQWNAERAEGTLDIASDRNGHVATRGALRGTLAWLDGELFATRPMGTGSVALVDAGGIAGIPVLRSGQHVTSTDARGRALVPNLMPWLPNRIDLDPAGLPMDVQVGDLAQEVVPYARGATQVKFGVRRSRQALVILRTEDGRDVPSGATVTTWPQNADFLVGLRGEAWLMDLQEDGQQLRVQWPGGRCALKLDVLDSAVMAPTLGPLTCAEARP